MCVSGPMFPDFLPSTQRALRTPGALLGLLSRSGVHRCRGILSKDAIRVILSLIGMANQRCEHERDSDRQFVDNCAFAFRRKRTSRTQRRAAPGTKSTVARVAPIPVSVKKTLLRRGIHVGEVSPRSSKLGAGEQFPPLHCQAEAGIKGMFFLSFVVYILVCCPCVQQGFRLDSIRFDQIRLDPIRFDQIRLYVFFTDTGSSVGRRIGSRARVRIPYYVCVCMYIYIYIYTHICVYIIYIYIYMYVYIYIYIYTCIQIHIGYMHNQTYVHMFVYLSGRSGTRAKS